MRDMKYILTSHVRSHIYENRIACRVHPNLGNNILFELYEDCWSIERQTYDGFLVRLFTHDSDADE